MLQVGGDSQLGVADSKGMLPMHHAAGHSTSWMLEVMQEAGVEDPDLPHFCEAAGSTSAAVVRLLLGAGGQAQLRAVDRDSSLPMHTAARPSRTPSLCTHITSAGIEWRC